MPGRRDRVGQPGFGGKRPARSLTFAGPEPRRGRITALGWSEQGRKGQAREDFARAFIFVPD